MSRHTTAWIFVAAMVICTATPSAHAQPAAPVPLHGYYRAIPLHGSDEVSPALATAAGADAIAAAATAASASTVPMWKYGGQVDSRNPSDHKLYSGVMVGRSPFFHGARTTNINTILVPVRVTFIDSQKNQTVFDPTQPDSSGCLPNPSYTASSLVQQSPILMSANFTMNGVEEGNTQYIDAFQRANFFAAVNRTGDRYHTLLNLGKVANASITISGSSGEVLTTPCGQIGIVNVSALQKIAEKTLLPALKSNGVGPTTVPILLFYNVVMSDGTPENPPDNCCILGFHSGIGSASRIQLYAVADYDSSGAFTNDSSPLDTTVLSHETAELTDDPLGNNPAPSWGNIGQVNGCQNNLEVGDPLSGTAFPPVTMPNRVTYHLQELAFYSWFFGGTSIGAGGRFSDNGTFTTDAGGICQ